MYDKKTKGRIQQLKILLNQIEKLHLRDASEILNVSEMTIRRDIGNSDGSIVLLGGYLVKKVNHRSNYFLSDQQDKNIVEKMLLGKTASKFVENGDIVFFDCGTTIPFIASNIPDSINFTAVCCSINVFMVLREKRNCEIILCGGSYCRDNELITSIQVKDILDSICTTKAFIATSGVDINNGLTCFHFNEAKVKQQAMMKTKEKILVFDHSKFNFVHPAYIGELDEFDMIICDQSIPSQFQFDRKKFVHLV
ncbi:DNA-binding transcriptional repressor DeoR [Gallibacterium anatis]|uniref:DNA-binding transcriptional repressor DeoR n=1 Tax=Gallibacterium anatis TaxID=750 RepID=A0AAX3XDA0_9PAST|nr:DNA-binding transcriptional repressor DeoR [Gallibacterium anatis]MDK9429868.1 DNA-binding transcriptional repressor DeoR [Gallibacterium anatis]WIM78927.1 DNA-binding transcriptional repressor DeoR [Gallibacterium anatis]WIM81406.1 DNA-binding transcriptional repressor DeoR [Gallibacterium anatis]